MHKTLAAVLGFGAVEAGVKGTSFAPLLLNGPGGRHSEQYPQYPRCARGADCMMLARADIEAMGYSVRAEGARYTEWRTWDGAALRADWSAAGLLGQELYPHAASDPALNMSVWGGSENANEAANPAHAALAQELAQVLATQFSAKSAC